MLKREVLLNQTQNGSADAQEEAPALCFSSVIGIFTEKLKCTPERDGERGAVEVAGEADERGDEETRGEKMTRRNDGGERKQMEAGREDLHLFAVTLSVLIFNKEVKLIRLISNDCL